MADDSVLPFSFPAIHGRKVTAAFDGGRLTSDGGVLLLAQAERGLGIAGRLASCGADPRDQGRVIHSLDGILRARILAIACGYEDADDLDTLRHDPGFKALLSLSKDWRLENCRMDRSALPANPPCRAGRMRRPHVNWFGSPARWSTFTARVIQRRRRRSRSISMTPAMSLTACSN
jgi:hypothetical protein